MDVTNTVNSAFSLGNFGSRIISLARSSQIDLNGSNVVGGPINMNPNLNGILAGLATTVAKQYLDEGITVSEDDIAKVVSTVSGVVGAMRGADKGGGDGGAVIVENNGNPMYGDKNGRLTYEPNPIDIELNTGIVPNCALDYYHSSVSHYDSVHLTNGRIALPVANTELRDYFNTAVYQEFLTSIQRAITYSVPSFFSPLSLYNCINATTEALQVFLFYDSILTITEGTNKYDGMNRLRSYITSTDLLNLKQLKDYLKTIPVPPNLATLCRYFMQTYAAGDLAGASLLKFCPVPLVINSTTGEYMPDSAHIALVTKNLETFRDVNSVLARACPKWIMGDIASSNMVPLYDEHFLTTWSNSPVYVTGPDIITNMTYPKCSNSFRSPIPYCSFTESLDGAAYGLTAFYNTDSGLWEPSLWHVFNSGFNDGIRYNRWSFVKNPDNTKSFKPSHQRIETAVSRGETNYTFNGFAEVKSHIPFGTTSMSYVSPDSVNQTATKLLNWVLTLDSLGVLPDKLEYKNSSSSKSSKKGGNYRGRKK